jgi:hypothetical protein
VRPARRGTIALVAALTIGAPAAGAHVVEYLHVTGNVGASSGGHAAVRFDDRVYHFQQRAPGVLRLVRGSFEHFLWAYGVLDNRSIRVARLRASAQTYELLLDRFNERYLAEEKQFRMLAALTDDQTLFAALLAHAAHHGSGAVALPAPLRLPAVGLFDPAADAESAVLADLRDEIGAVHGARALESRQVDVALALRRLRPSRPADPVVGPAVYPTAGPGFAERYVDLALAHVAVETLVRALPLRREVRRAPPAAEAPLTVPEAARLRTFRDRLRAGLVQLVMGSERPDWGHAVLVGMARLQVIDETLVSGRWVVCDAFPDDARTMPGAATGPRRRFLEDLRTDASAATRAARRALVAGDVPGERDYAAVEEAANRLAEVTRGLADGGTIREGADILLPSRSARGWPVPAPELSRHEVAQAAAASARAADRQRVALEAAYGYDLFARNCVSEIFATIEAALGRDGSVERLGGYLDLRGGLSFWPWASFRAVRAAYDTAAVEEIPSYRLRRLARMYRTEPRALAYLREANTLTSTLYRPTGDDSFFVFFTDDVAAPRPIYGAVNVAAGLGELLLGALLSPLDRGRSLWLGVKGVVFSLPELAFVNIRKGSMAYGRLAAGAGSLEGEQELGAPP